MIRFRSEPQTPECGRRYADLDGPLCDRPAGHREDSTNVYRDPDGAHQKGGLLWTNKWSVPGTGSSGQEPADD